MQQNMTAKLLSADAVFPGDEAPDTEAAFRLLPCCLLRVVSRRCRVPCLPSATHHGHAPGLSTNSSIGTGWRTQGSSLWLDSRPLGGLRREGCIWWSSGRGQLQEAAPELVVGRLLGSHDVLQAFDLLCQRQDLKLALRDLHPSCPHPDADHARQVFVRNTRDAMSMQRVRRFNVCRRRLTQHIAALIALIMTFTTHCNPGTLAVRL